MNRYRVWTAVLGLAVLVSAGCGSRQSESPLRASEGAKPAVSADGGAATGAGGAAAQAPEAASPPATAAGKAEAGRPPAAARRRRRSPFVGGEK